MRPLHVVLIFAACVLATSSPIIRVKNSNGQKKSYCCYGVVRPFDMMAKAKQGLRALNQVGFSLKQVRQALGIQQKTLEGKLEKAEKKAEVISSKVQQALKDTMKILSDATKKAAAKLGQVAAVTNDLGQLEKDLEETKSHDVINQIRDLINENPVLKGKVDDHEKAKKKSKAKKEKDDEKSKKQDKLRKPKDSIPTSHSEDEENAVARSLLSQEKKQKEQLKWAKDVINIRSQENKRAFEKTQNLLSRIEEGLLQFKNGF